ncbi:hypothetical protein HOV93_09680 [Planctomycetes bacterium FF15]|uniref:Uncharacterized protein n=1 Tax=Bremerella alba TaxID=980252 RepID=A0A7V8V2L9_9BACT|nr:hypothetical protein [Bremerella alba]
MPGANAGPRLITNDLILFNDFAAVDRRQVQERIQLNVLGKESNLTISQQCLASTGVISAGSVECVVGKRPTAKQWKVRIDAATGCHDSAVSSPSPDVMRSGSVADTLGECQGVARSIDNVAKPCLRVQKEHAVLVVPDRAHFIASLGSIATAMGNRPYADEDPDQNDPQKASPRYSPQRSIKSTDVDGNANTMSAELTVNAIRWPVRGDSVEQRGLKQIVVGCDSPRLSDSGGGRDNGS